MDTDVAQLAGERELYESGDKKVVLKNGDCLELMKELPAESIDSIITDPPYNTGMKLADTSNKGTRLKYFFNDDYTTDEYATLVHNSCVEFMRVLKQNTGSALFINWKQLGLWLSELEKAGFSVKNVIVWDKMHHGLNYMNYAYTYELIIYFTKGKFAVNNKTLYDKAHKLYTDVWRIKRIVAREGDSENHETIKPEFLIGILLSHLTKEGDTVLDPFMGSGTTGFACVKANRSFIGMELYENYYNSAKRQILLAINQSKLFK